MREVGLAFLKLGLTAFGGPIAHLGYFRDEFVGRRRWLSDAEFADLVALAQFLPGPTSSQVGIAIGLSRAGLPGACAAWLGFTLPSALALGFAGLHGGALGPEWRHGLKLIAVPIVAQAILNMARTLSRGRRRALITAVSLGISIVLPGTAAQLAVIAGGALLGRLILVDAAPSSTPTRSPAWSSAWSSVRSRCAGALGLVAFAATIVIAQMLVATTDSPLGLAIGKLMRTTSLVFGGGHVVLPLIKSEFVGAGLLTADQVLSGYGLAQAVPGPLFTVAAYYGAVLGGGFGAAACTLAVFLPAFALILGVWPFWAVLKHSAAAKSILGGVGAAVVGLLIAALYDPVWTDAITNRWDLTIVVAGFVLLEWFKTSPWAVVGLTVLAARATVRG